MLNEEWCFANTNELVRWIRILISQNIVGVNGSDVDDDSLGDRNLDDSIDSDGDNGSYNDNDSENDKRHYFQTWKVSILWQMK